MIRLTFRHPDTSVDVDWDVNFKLHSPFEETRFTSEAEAADYLEPETHFKGNYDTTRLTSNPLPASEMVSFNLFKRATLKGETFTVGASVVPLVGQDYIAKRVGNLKPVSTRTGRHFTFSLNCRVTELVP